MTYDSMLTFTLNEFEKQAHCMVDDASDTAIKFKVIAAELARLYDLLEYYKKQVFPNTAEGEYLDRHGAVRGIVRKSASPASGRVIFHCLGGAAEDISIPAGTLLGSSQCDLVFHTLKDVVLKQGATYVEAVVESSETGSRANLAAGLLNLLITPIVGITSVENPNKLAGGAEEESEESYRSRVMEAFRQVSNGANLHYYEQFAKNKSGVWFAKASFVSGSSNHIQLCVENATRTLSDSIITELSEEMEEARELNVKLTVQRPVQKAVNLNMTVYVNNMAGGATLSILAEEAMLHYIQSLSIGENFSPTLAGRTLLEIPGIRDVSFTGITPSTIGKTEIAIPGEFSIKIAS